MGGNVKSAPSQISYMIGINGQQAGPFDWDQLHKLALQGQFTRETYVWTQGMQNWEFAGNVRELDPLFANIVPQINGIRKF
jgi:hypothetical protein